MKKELLLFLSIFYFGFNWVAANSGNPSDYMNQIGSHYKEITQKTWEYTSALAKDKNARKIEKKRTALLDEIKSAISSVKKMNAFNGDNALRDTVVAYLNLNYDVLNDDYSKIADLEELAEQSYDMMEAYLTLQNLANEKLRAAGERLTQAERDFAERNNVTLIEGEETKIAARLRKASAMWKYYNNVYLIFFKSYLLESQMMQAINAGDMNAAEQVRNSLLEIATEGLNDIAKLQPYEGDNSLILAAKEIVSFYKKEAEKDILTILDFQLKREHFDKVNESFQKLSKKDRTQPAVDEYNKAVKEYNESIVNYNKINDSLNKERAKQLDNWNNTVSKFTSKNIK